MQLCRRSLLPEPRWGVEKKKKPRYPQRRQIAEREPGLLPIVEPEVCLLFSKGGFGRHGDTVFRWHGAIAPFLCLDFSTAGSVS